MKTLIILLCLVATPALAERMAVVDQSNVIVNLIEASNGFTLPNMTIVTDAGYAIGGTLVNGVYTAPTAPAAATRSLSFLELMALFTPDEQAAIVSSADTQVKLFLLMATGAKAIYVTDPRTTQGFDLLVSKGLLTPEREAAILAGM